MGSLETATTQPGHTMGTKLSKATNTPPADKSTTLPAPHNDEDESKVAVQSETLPRSGFERTTGLGKSFRKSMRKLVGKKKVKEEEAEKKESDKVEENTENGETKEGEQEENFKTAQQKARADFFKEMYTDNEEEMGDKKEEKKEEEKKEEEIAKTLETDAKEDEEEAVNVSLIGTPVEESQQETSPGEESVEAVERDAANEMLDKHQSGRESSNLQEKSDEMKKPDGDVNNEEGNETEQSEGKGEGDNEVNEPEETEIAAVTQDDVTDSKGNDEEMETAQEDGQSEHSDAEKSNADEKSTEIFDENLIDRGPRA